MDDDEVQEIVPPRDAGVTPRALETLSIKELDEYIAQLAREIERVREMIDSKKGTRTDAESVFKK